MFHVLSANCTTLDHVPLLAALLGGPGVLAVQEPRGGALAADKARASARPLGALAAGCLGVNQFLSCVTRDAPFRQCPLPGQDSPGARLAHYAVGLGAGTLHVFNVYAPCGSDAQAGGVASCSALIVAALERAAELGQVPCLLLGDFNQDPLPRRSAAALALGGWRDLAAGLGVTTRPGGGRKAGASTGCTLTRLRPVRCALSLCGGTPASPPTLPSLSPWRWLLGSFTSAGRARSL